MTENVSGLPIHIKKRVNALVSQRASEANEFSTLPKADRFQDTELQCRTQDTYLQQQRDHHRQKNDEFRRWVTSQGKSMNP